MKTRKYTVTKLTLTLAIGIFSVSSAISQKAEFGIKGGLHLSDVSTSGLNLGLNFLEPKMTAGYSAGLYAEVPVGQGLYFAPELNYVQKGFRIAEGVNVDLMGLPIPLGAEVVTRLNYVEMPLALKYKFGTGPVAGYLKAGPTLGYATNGVAITRVNSIIDFNVARTPLNLQGSLYNAFEVGAQVGAGAEFRAGNGKFFVDATFSHGFTDMLNEPVIDLRVKNMGLGLGVGYAFAF